MSESEHRCKVCNGVMELSEDGTQWTCLCGHVEPVEDKDLPPGAYRARHGEA